MFGVIGGKIMSAQKCPRKTIERLSDIGCASLDVADDSATSGLKIFRRASKA